jgi:hypothetical protein
LADWLLKVAMDTERLCPGQSIRKLALSCEQQYQVDLLQQEPYFEERDNNEFTFSLMAAQR